MSSVVNFNDQPLRNDLVGRLSGSVLFAQSSVIPSLASALPDDIQPHLVASRDTLLLFKPLQSSFDASRGVEVKVFQKGGGKDAFLVDMSPPEELPKIAEHVEGGDEFFFIEHEGYSHKIDSQDQLSSLNADDTDGSKLLTILEQHQTVKVETADGQWIRDFYLPNKIPESISPGCLVTFESTATFHSNIHYDGKVYVLNQGDKKAFKLQKTDKGDQWQWEGKWVTLDDVSIKDAIEQFAEPRTYGKEVASSHELNSMKDDTSGTQISSLLRINDTVKIKVADGRWIKDFYLPKDDSSQDGKVVTFNSDAGYTAYVHYNDLKVSFGRGQTLVFKNYQGNWLEWADVWYSKIRYGEDFWSAVLPKRVVQPGMKLSFENGGVAGNFNKAEVGAATELLLHTIDVGLLTPHADTFEFQKDPEYHRQYFQQVPISRLVVTEYEPITLDEIVLPDGTKYTDASPDTGGIHTGDMRQHIAKVLLLLGINDANYGINSSAGGRAQTTYTCGQITCATSRGKYSNGVVVHGKSGGNSMGNLENSIGNEWSHEIGHNFGMGHYPNNFEGSVHRPAGSINSTWGWDSNKNVFLPNFQKQATGESTGYDGKVQEPFNGYHSFGKDAMAGGEPLYLSVNEFTLHTPYTLDSIQKFLESKVSFDRASKTGMIKWNEDTESMEPYAEMVHATPTDCAVESTMHNLLNRHKLVKVSFYDGYWNKDILVPKATSKMRGKGITIDHLATWSSTLRINDQNITVSTGDVLMYEISEAYNCRDLQPMKDDTEGTYLATVLTEHPLARVHTWNGHWIRNFYLPKDNAALDGTTIGFGSSAGYNSHIHYNGKTHLLTNGTKVSFKNDKGKWRKIAYEEDEFFYWKKVDELSIDVVKISTKRGVPVVTLVGYYDPLGEMPSYAYPALYGAYGYTFEPNSANEVGKSKCYASITNAEGRSLSFLLKGKRVHEESMNRYQVNVEAAFQPTQISITCNGQVVAQRDIQPSSKKMRFSYTVNGLPL